MCVPGRIGKAGCGCARAERTTSPTVYTTSLMATDDSATCALPAAAAVAAARARTVRTSPAIAHTRMPLDTPFVTHRITRTHRHFAQITHTHTDMYTQSLTHNHTLTRTHREISIHIITHTHTRIRRLMPTPRVVSNKCLRLYPPVYLLFGMLVYVCVCLFNPTGGCPCLYELIIICGRCSNISARGCSRACVWADALTENQIHVCPRHLQARSDDVGADGTLQLHGLGRVLDVDPLWSLANIVAHRHQLQHTTTPPHPLSCSTQLYHELRPHPTSTG